MNAVSRLRANTALLMISNVGGAVFSFALAALIGRVLGADGLGVYGTVAAWIYPLALLADFGVSSWLTRALASDGVDAEAGLRSAALHRLIVGGVIMIGVIAAAPILSGDPRVAAGLRLNAPMVIILPFYSAFTAVFRARGDVRAIPFLNMGMIAAQAGLTLVAFALGGGLTAALILNVATSAGQLAAAWAVYRRRFYRAAWTPRPPLGRLTRESVHFALAGVFAALQARLSLILLETLAGTAAAGYFTAANRFIDAARLLPNAFFGALFPALTGLTADPAALTATFRRARRRLAAYSIGVIVGAWLLGALALRWVFGAAFAPAYPVLCLLAIALAASLLRGLATLYWYGQGREARVNAVNAGVIVVLAAASLIAIPAAGAVGAAAALIIGEVLGYAGLRHHTPVHSGTIADAAARTASPMSSPKKNRHSDSASAGDANA